MPPPSLGTILGGTYSKYPCKGDFSFLLHVSLFLWFQRVYAAAPCGA